MKAKTERLLSEKGWRQSGQMKWRESRGKNDEGNWNEKVKKKLREKE